jgi:acyl-CoA thioesterase FadM
MTSRYRATFHQRIERSGELIANAEVELVCLDRDQNLISFPRDLQALADQPIPPGRIIQK